MRFFRVIRVDDDALEGKADYPVREKPKDWPFMEQSGVLLDRLPAEWGATADIIALEYEKLANAETERQKKVALVRLASACLYEWRKLNA